MVHSFFLHLINEGGIWHNAWEFILLSEIPQFTENNMSSLELLRQLLQHQLTEAGSMQFNLVHRSPLLTDMLFRCFLKRENTPYWMQGVEFSLKKGHGHPNVAIDICNQCGSTELCLCKCTI